MLHSYMKRVLFSLVLALSLFTVQAQGDVKDQVVSALGSGDAAVLAKNMVANVDMTLPTAGDYYSKAQAEQMLRKFFGEHAPKAMSIQHEGTNRSGDHYFIGQLVTANGDFRVTFFLKKVDNGYRLKQLRIETGKSGQ